VGRADRCARSAGSPCHHAGRPEHPEGVDEARVKDDQCGCSGSALVSRKGSLGQTKRGG
jgi:hypothetical protein